MPSAPLDRGPGDLQLEILDVLWQTPDLTAAAVRDALAGRRDLALTTVATVLQRMSRSGLVEYRADKRQHLYRAAVSRQQMRRNGVAALLTRLFDGKPATLVSHLVETDGLTAADRRRMRALLDDHRPRGKK